ncbi:hypothetical protein AVEN_62313-1 [Araneus ventricosus]|uniref:Uncharacterized protein n=1 Tax=Araneus ventricosus TaxID=182803 RepID=A0A4Y2KTW1_ARAVE|nr:hypothetical protein AVEN_62313-1 [Araneus ventricosus]
MKSPDLARRHPVYLSRRSLLCTPGAEAESMAITVRPSLVGGTHYHRQRQVPTISCHQTRFRIWQLLTYVLVATPVGLYNMGK